MKNDKKGYAKWTPLVEDKVVEMLGKGYGKTRIAHDLGISYDMINYHENKSERVQKRFAEAQITLIETIETAAVKNAVENLNPTMQIFLLQNLKPEKYQDRRNMQITGKDGNPIEIKFVYDKDWQDRAEDNLFLPPSRALSSPNGNTQLSS